MPAESSPSAMRDPGLGWVLFTILLPIGLMLLRTTAELALSDNSQLRPVLHTAQLLGDPAVAMLIAVLVSFSRWEYQSEFPGGKSPLPRRKVSLPWPRFCWWSRPAEGLARC